MELHKCLIVDDDELGRDLVAQNLPGVNCIMAADGQEAVKHFSAALAAGEPFNLVVLDIMLPDIDGYEVCRTLRTNMRTSHIPVIFLTQKDERSDKLQGLELGADDYITKPFDIEELKLRVQGAIRRSERESLTDPRSGLPAGRLIEEQLRLSTVSPFRNAAAAMVSSRSSGSLISLSAATSRSSA